MFEKTNKTDLKVLKFLSDNPYTEYHLREIQRKTKISPSSTKKALDLLKSLNLIKEKKIANLRIFSGNMEEILLKKFKIINNIEFLKPLIEEIKPAISIVLYGSYAKGENDSNSDIDLFVITNKKNKIQEYKNKKVQMAIVKPNEWSKLKNNNKAYTEEIKKGILLHGEELI